MTTHMRSAVALTAVTLFLAAVTAAQTGKPVIPKPGTLAITVVTESGATLSGAAVLLRGGADRQVISGADGVGTLLNIPAGTYRVRINRDGYVSLEKEVTIRAGLRTAGEAALTAVPSAPPPAPPPPKEKEKEREAPRSTDNQAGPVGAAKVLSVLDLAEQMLNDKAPIVERELGCSVATASRLILVRETFAAHSHADADEVLYLVAGDATLKIADKDTSISAGWFGLVPRGTSHSMARRGRNAPIFLSVRSGQPCGS